MANNGVMIVLGIVAVVLIGAIALICSSFTDLEFDEMGFARSKTTGSVDTSKVYSGGRHWLGPDATMKKFTATAHRISLSEVDVFAASDRPQSGSTDSDEGGSVTITIGIDLVYFLVRQDLKLLHDEYDVNYRNLMQTSAVAAIKDAASLYKLEDYFERREEVEEGIHESVRRRLGGECCPVDRKVDGCIPRSQCTAKDKGLFVDVVYLQLTSFSIPYSVEHRNLQALILTEDTAKQSFVQKVSVIEKETERQVANITNEAAETEATAGASAQLIEARSKANYQKILENARRDGLRILYSSLGLSSIQHKNSFDYLRSLGDHENAHLTVDFDQLIMGPTNFN